jgi:hypothetical protein
VWVFSPQKVDEWVESFKSGRARRRFTSDEEVKEAVHTWLQEQPKSFFFAGI